MPRVFIYGGNGSLGRTLVRLYKKKNWKTISVDFGPNPDAEISIPLKQNLFSLTAQSQYVHGEVAKILSPNDKVDAVLNVAGGWTGGNLNAKNFEQTVEDMIHSSIYSSVIAAKLASKYLKPYGFLLLPGAAGALSPTPGAIGYGIAKSAVHHLTKTLAQDDSGLPEGSTVIAIAPTILDTEANRKAMPNADFSTWVNLEELAYNIYEWQEKRPFQSGTILKISANDGRLVHKKIE